MKQKMCVWMEGRRFKLCGLEIVRKLVVWYVNYGEIRPM